MGIDSSIALNANAPKPTNPLAFMSQYAQNANALVGLQAAQQKIAAQNALGRAAQDAIGADGTFNAATFAQDVKNDPSAAYGALDGIQEGQKAAGSQYGLNAAQLAQTVNRTNAVGAGMAGLLSKGNLTPQDIFTSLAGQAAAGKPVGEFVQSVMPSMPALAANEDPAAYSGRLKSWVAGVTGQSAGPEAALRALTPNVQTVGLGGTTQTVDANPYTNPNATNMVLQNTLSPEGQATPVTGPVGPQGQHTTLPRAAYAAGNGLGNLLPGGSPFGTGRPGGLPTSLFNPNRPAAGQAGAPGAPVGTAPGGLPAAGDPQGVGSTSGGSAPTAPGFAAPMVTDLGAGQVAGLATAGKASADQWAALQQQVGGTAAGGGSAGRIYQLQSALGDLQQLGQTGSGPSAGTVNTLKSYLASLPGIGSYVPQGTVDSIANYDMANKALTNYATARAGARGGTTDNQLAATLSGNASAHISNLAAQDVVRANIGLERMDQAQAQAFASAKDQRTGQPLSPDQFSTWSANWSNKMDPRAFIVPELSPGQVQKTISGMSPADRVKFQQTYNTGVANGWISPPAWATPLSSSSATAPANDSMPSTADMAINPTGTGN